LYLVAHNAWNFSGAALSLRRYGMAGDLQLLGGFSKLRMYGLTKVADFEVFLQKLLVSYATGAVDTPSICELCIRCHVRFFFP
jgi:hypothetical protein